MENINAKFENAFNDYMSNNNKGAFNLMIEMFNNREITPEQYRQKYECLFPQMGDASYCGEDVNLDEFFGFHVEL